MTTARHSTLLLLFFLSGTWGQTFQPQNVSVPFWEPLPFASLPVLLQTVALFYQDPVSTQGKLLTVAGAHNLSYNVNSVYQMDVALERWELLATTGDTLTPRVHHAAAVLKNSSSGESYIAVYGGYSYQNLGGTLTLLPLGDFALLNLDTLQWKNKGVASKYTLFQLSWVTCCSNCSACPMPRALTNAVVFSYEPEVMYLFGGQSYSNTLSVEILTDLWKYDIRNDSWTQMRITNAASIPAIIPGAMEALSAYNVSKRIVLFSGYYYNAQNYPVLTGNNLWMLEETAVDTWTWIQVIPNNTYGPPPRVDALHEIVGSLFLIWGGNTGVQTVIGPPMWVLNTSNPAYSSWNWTIIDILQGQFEPEDTAGSGLIFVPTQAAMTVVGGYTDNGTEVDRLYKFHAEGLFPPVPNPPEAPDVVNAYSFQASGNGSVFNFPSTAPNIAIVPKGGNITNTTSSVQATFGVLIERTPAGTEVARLELPVSDFIVGYQLRDSTTGEKVTIFTRHGLANLTTGSVLATTVRFEFYQFTSDGIIDANDETGLPPNNILLPAGWIKFNIRISNWPFLNALNTLDLDFQLNIGSTFVPKVATSSDSTLSISNPNILATLQLLNYSVADTNDTQPVVYQVLTDNNNQVIIRFTFQSFKSTLHYDPSLSVFFGDVNDSGDGNASGDGNNTAIFVGVFVSLGGVLLLMIILASILFGLLWYNKHRTLRRMRTISGLSSLHQSASDLQPI